MNPNIFKALYDEAAYKQAAKSFFYWISEDCEGTIYASSDAIDFA
jgi:hypothetical protein